MITVKNNIKTGWCSSKGYYKIIKTKILFEKEDVDNLNTKRIIFTFSPLYSSYVIVSLEKQFYNNRKAITIKNNRITITTIDINNIDKGNYNLIKEDNIFKLIKVND